MNKIGILGVGSVGRAIAYDLSKEYDITGFDISKDRLAEVSEFIGIKTEQLDISDTDYLKSAISSFDLVISAVPGEIGFQTLKSVIEAGKNCVDISFFPESALDLNELAEKHNVTVIVDAGVAPGLSNLVLGYHCGYMKVHSFNCYVGGLPFERKMPFQYKAPFSPNDVLEEYIRKVRYRIAGQDIVIEPLTDLELLHFDAVGTLEAFNTDGLRTLLISYPEIRYMREKTLRYPGHADLIKAFMETGLLSQDEIDINGTKIKPYDLTSELLIDKWKMDENDNEFTVMRILIDGEGKDEAKRFQYDLFDITDNNSGLSSMARTTGFTASSIALLLMNGNIKNKGVITPEEIGEKSENFKFIVDHLEERGIILEVEQK